VERWFVAALTVVVVLDDPPVALGVPVEQLQEREPAADRPTPPTTGSLAPTSSSSCPGSRSLLHALLEGEEKIC
jgi:hypothetical protein